jgi:Transglycosylase SLT domain/Sel1 repeat
MTMAARTLIGLLAASAFALSGAAGAQQPADAFAGYDSSATSRELVARALAHEHGEGVPKDLVKAAYFYCEAARRGDAEGQYGLGWMYANGRGLPNDDAFAAGLFALAAAQGHAQAQRMQRFVGDATDRLPDCMQPATMPAAVLVFDDGADMFKGLPPYKQKFAELVRTLAPKYDVSPRLALAIVAVESNFEPYARSPKNARGLMQLIPDTATRFSVKNAYDPVENVRGGLSYLRWLLAYYRGQVDLAAAAYNAGEGAVDRHRGVPPYAETRDYVQKIRRLYGAHEHPYNPRLAEPSPLLGATRAARM